MSTNAIPKSPSKTSKRKNKEGKEVVSSPKKQKKTTSESQASSSVSSKDQRHGGVQVKLDVLKKEAIPRSLSGIALASFADYKPASSATFSLYRARGLALGPNTINSGSNNNNNNKDKTDDRLLLAGETDTMSYIGDNFEAGSSTEARGYSGEYMVGVYDPSTCTVTLRAAPLFSVSRTVKALNNIGPISSDNPKDWSMLTKTRRDLGDAFGNRKQKLAAKNQDRMKVDTNNMESIMDEVTGGIEEAVASLPTMESIENAANANRPVPPADVNAKHPSHVYPLSVLIPSYVLRALPISKLTNCQDIKALRSALPKGLPEPLVSRTWSVVEHARNALNHGDDQSSSSSRDKHQAKDRLRAAFYITLLFSAISHSKKLGKKNELLEMLQLSEDESAGTVYRDLVQRFTETPKNENRPKLTTFMETKSYSFMMALCLYLENFSVSYSTLSMEFSLNPDKVKEILRSLGCKSAIGADKARRMVLKVPFELPKPRKIPARGAKK